MFAGGRAAVWGCEHAAPASAAPERRLARRRPPLGQARSERVTAVPTLQVFAEWTAKPPGLPGKRKPCTRTPTSRRSVRVAFVQIFLGLPQSKFQEAQIRACDRDANGEVCAGVR